MPQENRIEHLLLICGAVKSGTTWLFSVLRQHPLIASTPIKEIHYFTPANLPWEPLSDSSRIETMVRYFANYGPFAKQNPEDVDAARRDLDWFQRFLATPVDLDWFQGLFGEGVPGRWLADFSPFTSLADLADLIRIRDQSSARRLVYLIRNPLDRYWSHYNFHKSLFEPEQDITALSVAHYAAELDGVDFRLHGQYARFIANARRVFGSDELLVLPIEECRVNPLGATRTIEEFLGLPSADYAPESLGASIFPTRSLPIPEAFRLACRPLIERDCAALDDLGIIYPENYHDQFRILDCEKSAVSSGVA